MREPDRACSVPRDTRAGKNTGAMCPENLPCVKSSTEACSKIPV